MHCKTSEAAVVIYQQLTIFFAYRWWVSNSFQTTMLLFFSAKTMKRFVAP